MKDDIIKAVKSALEKTHKKSKDLLGRRLWTDAIMQQLCCACKSKKFKRILQCCPDRVDLNPGWLYDMIWYRMNGKGCLVETPLVLESEWSTRLADVRYDFEKLLVAKAKVKVLIADSCCHGDIKEMAANEIASFQEGSSDERYLLALWSAEGFEYTLLDGKGKIIETNERTSGNE